MRVLLASASPRRRELIKKLFADYDVASYPADEDYVGDTPDDTVGVISSRKLGAVPDKEAYDLIIACDTLVYMDGRYYGKPADYEDAVRMIGELEGKTHVVYSGLSVWYKGKIGKRVVTSRVTFRHLDDIAIRAYLDSHDCLDKAGAYAIQDGIVVERYEGSYDNIVGLPVEELEGLIEELITE